MVGRTGMHVQDQLGAKSEHMEVIRLFEEQAGAYVRAAAEKHK